MKRMVMKVNGMAHPVTVEEERSLLSVLRDDLDLTGTKYGCGEGQCGACTVLLDGKPVRSCLTSMGTADGKSVTTVEGLEKGGRLSPLQEAFLEEGAFQCAYCTSGMLMSATALLRKTPNPSQAEIVKAMEGNLCRCGTYPRITRAIQRAAKATREASR